MTKLEIDCSKAHCKCMQLSPCSNHHYKDCQPNWGASANERYIHCLCKGSATFPNKLNNPNVENLTSKS